MKAPGDREELLRLLLSLSLVKRSLGEPPAQYHLPVPPHGRWCGRRVGLRCGKAGAGLRTLVGSKWLLLEGMFLAGGV